MRKMFVLAAIFLAVLGAVGLASTAEEPMAANSSEVRFEIPQQPVADFLSAPSTEPTQCTGTGGEVAVSTIVIAANPCTGISGTCSPGATWNIDQTTGCCFYTCGNNCKWANTGYTSGTPCP